MYIYINIYFIYTLIKTEIGSWHTECSTSTNTKQKGLLMSEIVNEIDVILSPLCVYIFIYIYLYFN